VSKNSKVLNFEQELPARHLFRPLAMSTEQFGEKWTSTSCDTREHVTMTSRRSCEVVVDSVAKYLHFEAVDIKGLRYKVVKNNFIQVAIQVLDIIGHLIFHYFYSNSRLYSYSITVVFYFRQVRKLFWQDQSWAMTYACYI
jgi:hypothetical protein